MEIQQIDAHKFNSIYEYEFQDLSEKIVLKSCILKSAFDNKKTYTDEEKKSLQNDVDTLFTMIMNNSKPSNEFEFYFRENVNKDAILAARWIRNPESSERQGTLQILEPISYVQIKIIHNKAIEILKMDSLRWETAIEAKSVSTYSEDTLTPLVDHFPQIDANDWDQMILEGELALEIAQVFKRKKEEAITCARLTSTNYYKGNFEKAKIYATRCSELAEILNDEPLYLRALYLQSAMYRADAGKENNFEKQQNYYGLAVETAAHAAGIFSKKQLTDLQLKEKIYLNLGAAHADNPSGDLEKAAESYKIALEVSKPGSEDHARLNIRLGKVKLLQNDFAGVQDIIESLRNSKLSERVQVHAKYLEGQLMHDEKKFEKALKISNEGLALALKLGAKEDEKRLNDLIQNILASQSMM